LQCVSTTSPITFPQMVHAGLRVGRIGASSVRYEIGLFAADEPTTAARGHFVHVYVDRHTRRPVPLPPELTHALQGLL
jgi:acyl-CoA thioester hydrolase